MPILYPAAVSLEKHLIGYGAHFRGHRIQSIGFSSTYVKN